MRFEYSFINGLFIRKTYVHSDNKITYKCEDFYQCDPEKAKTLCSLILINKGLKVLSNLNNLQDSKHSLIKDL